ncbi:MAG: bifunctional diaminohydroxyphosphoribosylaminopyrimidine deaminase/5-amino-6-(5-phosphoribosylamino)uracil reductase RibD [Dehalococcoidia bacterium]|nr:bifunctional diaminohydroxyphosphoribosylaminopyrimidine deaminase/5-amino-6-(5-phosphoribosylamino)uracil reductase RibD [Dehalococcoidia bacterium]
MDYMEQAIALAKLAQGNVSPNPAVGAVLVRNGEVAGQGFTQPPGEQHAEIAAIEAGGERVRGGTLYVTMEPCCHFGRTGPCTRAIIEAGISQVHMAMIDPNPLVSGKGRAELEAAGIKTFVGEQEEQARQLVEAYSKHITSGMPFVTVKFAMSLDGKIATHTGDSKWISNEESRQFAHSLRHNSDAIMTGANTVLADNPHLTARSSSGRGGTSKNQPLRIVIDGRGRTSQNAQLFQEAGKTILVMGRPAEAHEKASFAGLQTEILEFPSDDGIIQLDKLLKMLGERQITSILVEAGGILVGSLFDQGLVDKVYAFVAPIIIGGAARTPVEGSGASRLMDAFRLDRVSVGAMGSDVLISGYIANKSGRRVGNVHRNS